MKITIQRFTSNQFVQVLFSGNNPLYYDIKINLSNITNYLISCKEGGNLSGDERLLGYLNLDDLIPMVVKKLSNVRKKYCSGDNDVVTMNQVM